jgi:hypothetical protein
MEKKFCHFFVNFVSRKIRLLVKIFRGTRKFFRAARKIFVTDRLLLRKLFVKFFGAARKFSRFLGITLWPLCNCSEKVLSGRFYLECPARAAASRRSLWGLDVQRVRELWSVFTGRRT